MFSTTFQPQPDDLALQGPSVTCRANRSSGPLVYLRGPLERKVRGSASARAVPSFRDWAPRTCCCSAYSISCVSCDIDDPACVHETREMSQDRACSALERDWGRHEVAEHTYLSPPCDLHRCTHTRYGTHVRVRPGPSQLRTTAGCAQIVNDRLPAALGGLCSQSGGFTLTSTPWPHSIAQDTVACTRLRRL